MKTPPRLVLLVFAALALWALRGRLVGTDDAGIVAATDAAGRATAARTDARTDARGDPGEDICTVPRELPQRGALALHPRADPFAARSAEAATPVRKAAAPPVPVAASAPAPVAVRAPLPYRYLGGLDDPRGGGASVFLSLGGQLITARPGDTLEGGFRLERIAPRELVFRHLQRDETVRLAIEGEPQ